jgi:quercetin dioxygenase-like cupin family protein
MGALERTDAVMETIGEKRVRYPTHTEKLMMVVFDVNDGPTSEPDPPHNHSHGQLWDVAAGEIIFFLDGEPTPLSTGDMFALAPSIPHSVQ